MSTESGTRDRVAVVGYAHSQVERHNSRSLGELALDTAQRAIADAGLTVEQVDGFTTGALFPTAGAHAVEDGVSIVTSEWLAEHLGANPRYVEGFRGVGQIPGTVALAVNAIASGAADYVVMHRALHNPTGRYHGNPMTGAAGMTQWTAPQGYFGPLAMIALPYQEYLQRYGATRETMAEVLVEARKNGARIPWSFWYDQPLTADEYLAAPMIADPICRYDCDIPVDGVAVFVFTSAERAKDLPHRPVLVSGQASGLSTVRRLPLHWPLDDIMATGFGTAQRLWEAAGVGPADVDIPQVYDGFSPFVYFWLEVLGFCPEGQAHELVADGGIDSDAPDALPALSGGGALGNGRMHGVPQMLECYLQLSGRAGDRQRSRAEVGVACHSSPHFGGAVVYRVGLTDMGDVPTTLDQVLDPGWLSRALDDIDTSDRIVAVEEVDASQTLAQKVRFRVTVEGADGTRRTRAYCVKAHLDGSPGADLLSEAHFYGELAPQLDVRIPRAYYTAVDDAAQQAMIIMDDVVADGGHFLNAHTPYSPDTARDTLGQLARLHAATWGCTEVADLPWLSPRVTGMADIFPLDALQALLDDGRGPDVAPELRSAANVAEAMRRTGAHEVTCVIHADPHSGNSYLDADGRACWLDWQIVQRGNWATDISYHLATVLDVETRRTHEAELLRHYLRELESLGAPAPPWDAAWEQYTLGFSYGYFLWVITRISSRAVVLVHIPRLAAALTDHDTFRRLGVI